MREMLSEVFASIRMNKQRSILAGISTAWGMFMLIVLLGVGQGVIRGIGSNYNYMRRNIMRVIPGTTALPFNGRQEGRDIVLDPDDAAFIGAQFGDVVSNVLPMLGREMLASKGRNNTLTTAYGVTPGYHDAKYIQVRRGRDINGLDLENNRKVCVISERMASQLMPGDGEAVGGYIQIGGIPFQVVGVYKPVRSFILVNDIFVPLSTATFLWEPSGHYDEIDLFLEGLDTKEKNEEFKQLLFEAMGAWKGFDANDVAALSLEENMDFFLMITGLLGAVSTAIWIIGILALVSGIVGVGNIMFISVRDRTFELGLRRVMGASDTSIMTLVITEAVITMLIFGYVGILAGIGTMRLVSLGTAGMGSADYNVFGSMDVQLSIVLIANLVLVVGGVIAGLGPARNAIRMELTEALNS